MRRRWSGSSTCALEGHATFALRDAHFTVSQAKSTAPESASTGEADRA